MDLRYSPRGTDGRPFISPNIFPVGYLTQFTGVSDDIDNGIEGGGNLLVLSSSVVEEISLEVQFLRAYYLAGGAASWSGAVAGDWVGFQLVAPATAGTSNPGAGAYDKYAVGTGVHMYIPNATQTGDWDLDLDETLNENVDFTKVVPVPADNADGFFDWDRDTGVVTLNASQTGRYNLFDFLVSMHAFVKNVPLIGSSSSPFTVPAIKPYLCLPHWHVKITLNNSTAKALSLGAFIYRGIK